MGRSFLPSTTSDRAAMSATSCAAISIFSVLFCPCNLLTRVHVSLAIEVHHATSDYSHSFLAQLC